MAAATGVWAQKAATAKPETGVCVVIGVGPGIGAAVAKRFASEGYRVALVSRTEKTLLTIADEIKASGGQALPVVADAGDRASLKAALKKVAKELGEVDVLVYNSSIVQMGSILEINPDKFSQSFGVSVEGCLTAMQCVVPGMIERKRGTVLITGATASLRGGKNFASFAVGKFGLRALAQSAAREFGPQGVHVSHVILDGLVNAADSTAIAPASVADTYWMLHKQPANTWTHELDLRPSTEKW